MIDTNHEGLEEEIAAYVLGALEPEDAAELERHAEGCECCREQIRWLTTFDDVFPDGRRSAVPRRLP